MRSLLKVISAHERELERHRLFAALDHAESIPALASMARGLAWWPMVFQDVLRLTHEYARGSEFEHLTEYSLDESVGHDSWYVHDLRVLGVEPPSLEQQFGPEFRPIRDACYALTAEVHRAHSAAQHVALLSALEPTGRLFFERISRALARVCSDRTLFYFTRSHLMDERQHDLFTEATHADLQSIALSTEERAQCEAMVSRVYGCFASVFTYLAERLDASVMRSGDVRELHVSNNNARALRVGGI